jgi:hypothetical protein
VGTVREVTVGRAEEVAGARAVVREMVEGRVAVDRVEVAAADSRPILHDQRHRGPSSATRQLYLGDFFSSRVLRLRGGARPSRL